MPNPRTPTAKARITGADQRHPERFKDRVDPELDGIGEPSIFLGPTEMAAWEAFKRELPWLTEADRTVLEMASKLRAKMWQDSTPVIGSMTLLRQCLGQLGATPADRSKITEPPESKNDPLAKFD